MSCLSCQTCITECQCGCHTRPSPDVIGETTSEEREDMRDVMERGLVEGVVSEHVLALLNDHDSLSRQVGTLLAENERFRSENLRLRAALINEVCICRGDDIHGWCEAHIDDAAYEALFAQWTDEDCKARSRAVRAALAPMTKFPTLSGESEAEGSGGTEEA